MSDMDVSTSQDVCVPLRDTASPIPVIGAGDDVVSRPPFKKIASCPAAATVGDSSGGAHSWLKCVVENLEPLLEYV